MILFKLHCIASYTFTLFGLLYTLAKILVGLSKMLIYCNETLVSLETYGKICKLGHLKE